VLPSRGRARRAPRPGRAAPASAGARRPGGADAAAPDLHKRRRTFRRQSAARRCCRLRSSGFAAPSPPASDFCRRDHGPPKGDADRLGPRNALRKTEVMEPGPQPDIEQAHPGLQERQDERGGPFPPFVSRDERRPTGDGRAGRFRRGTRRSTLAPQRVPSSFGLQAALRATSRQSGISLFDPREELLGRAASGRRAVGLKAARPFRAISTTPSPRR